MYRLERYNTSTDDWDFVLLFPTEEVLDEAVNAMYPYVAKVKSDNSNLLYQGFNEPQQFFVASLRARWVN